MRPKTRTLTAANTPIVYPLDWRSTADAAVQCIPTSASYTVAITVDNVLDSTVTPTWIDISDMANVTASLNKNIGNSVNAVRFTFEGTTGTSDGTQTVIVTTAQGLDR
jgi:hypothetical protein